MLALFGADAADISGQLAALGWVNGRPPPPIARALRDTYASEAGADAVRSFAREAVERLADAGSWRNALALAGSFSDRPAMAALLGRALRREDTLPGEQVAPWLALLSEAEAADDAVLAVARATGYGASGTPEAALRLLRGRFRGAGAWRPSAISRIEAEIVPHANASGSDEGARRVPPRDFANSGVPSANPSRVSGRCVSVFLIWRQLW